MSSSVRRVPMTSALSMPLSATLDKEDQDRRSGNRRTKEGKTSQSNQEYIKNKIHSFKVTEMTSNSSSKKDSMVNHATTFDAPIAAYKEKKKTNYGSKNLKTFNSTNAVIESGVKHAGREETDNEGWCMVGRNGKTNAKNYHKVTETRHIMTNNSFKTLENNTPIHSNSFIRSSTKSAEKATFNPQEKKNNKEEKYNATKTKENSFSSVVVNSCIKKNFSGEHNSVSSEKLHSLEDKPVISQPNSTEFIIIEQTSDMRRVKNNSRFTSGNNKHHGSRRKVHSAARKRQANNKARQINSSLPEKTSQESLKTSTCTTIPASSTPIASPIPNDSNSDLISSTNSFNVCDLSQNEASFVSSSENCHDLSFKATTPSELLPENLHGDSSSSPQNHSTSSPCVSLEENAPQQPSNLLPLGISPLHDTCSSSESLFPASMDTPCNPISSEINSSIISTDATVIHQQSVDKVDKADLIISDEQIVGSLTTDESHTNENEIVQISGIPESAAAVEPPVCSLTTELLDDATPSPTVEMKDSTVVMEGVAENKEEVTNAALDTQESLVEQLDQQSCDSQEVTPAAEEKGQVAAAPSPIDAYTGPSNGSYKCACVTACEDRTKCITASGASIRALLERFINIKATSEGGIQIKPLPKSDVMTKGDCTQLLHPDKSINSYTSAVQAVVDNLNLSMKESKAFNRRGNTSKIFPFELLRRKNPQSTPRTGPHYFRLSQSAVSAASFALGLIHILEQFKTKECGQRQHQLIQDFLSWNPDAPQFIWRALQLLDFSLSNKFAILLEDIKVETHCSELASARVVFQYLDSVMRETLPAIRNSETRNTVVSDAPLSALDTRKADIAKFQTNVAGYFNTTLNLLIARCPAQCATPIETKTWKMPLDNETWPEFIIRSARPKEESTDQQINSGRMCNWALRGICRERECPHAHTFDELKGNGDYLFHKDGCKFHPDGMCRNSRNCRFSLCMYYLRVTKSNILRLVELNKENEKASLAQIESTVAPSSPLAVQSLSSKDGSLGEPLPKPRAKVPMKPLPPMPELKKEWLKEIPKVPVGFLPERPKSPVVTKCKPLATVEVRPATAKVGHTGLFPVNGKASIAESVYSFDVSTMYQGEKYSPSELYQKMSDAYPKNDTYPEGLYAENEDRFVMFSYGEKNPRVVVAKCSSFASEATPCNEVESSNHYLSNANPHEPTTNAPRTEATSQGNQYLPSMAPFMPLPTPMMNNFSNGMPMPLEMNKPLNGNCGFASTNAPMNPNTYDGGAPFPSNTCFPPFPFYNPLDQNAGLNNSYLTMFLQNALNNLSATNQTSGKSGQPQPPLPLPSLFQKIFGFPPHPSAQLPTPGDIHCPSFPFMCPTLPPPPFAGPKSQAVSSSRRTFGFDNAHAGLSNNQNGSGRSKGNRRNDTSRTSISTFTKLEQKSVQQYNTTKLQSSKGKACIESKVDLLGPIPFEYEEELPMFEFFAQAIRARQLGKHASTKRMMQFIKAVHISSFHAFWEHAMNTIDVLKCGPLNQILLNFLLEDTNTPQKKLNLSRAIDRNLNYIQINSILTSLQKEEALFKQHTFPAMAAFANNFVDLENPFLAENENRFKEISEGVQQCVPLRTRKAFQDIFDAMIEASRSSLCVNFEDLNLTNDDVCSLIEVLPSSVQEILENRDTKEVLPFLKSLMDKVLTFQYILCECYKNFIIRMKKDPQTLAMNILMSLKTPEEEARIYMDYFGVEPVEEYDILETWIAPGDSDLSSSVVSSAIRSGKNDIGYGRKYTNRSSVSHVISSFDSLNIANEDSSAAATQKHDANLCGQLKSWLSTRSRDSQLVMAIAERHSIELSQGAHSLKVCSTKRVGGARRSDRQTLSPKSTPVVKSIPIVNGQVPRNPLSLNEEVKTFKKSVAQRSPLRQPEHHSQVDGMRNHNNKNNGERRQQQYNKSIGYNKRQYQSNERNFHNQGDDNRRYQRQQQPSVRIPFQEIGVNNSHFTMFPPCPMTAIPPMSPNHPYPMHQVSPLSSIVPLNSNLPMVNGTMAPIAHNVYHERNSGYSPRKYRQYNTFEKNNNKEQANLHPRPQKYGNITYNRPGYSNANTMRNNVSSTYGTRGDSSQAKNNFSRNNKQRENISCSGLNHPQQ